MCFPAEKAYYTPFFPASQAALVGFVRSIAGFAGEKGFPRRAP